MGLSANWQWDHEVKLRGIHAASMHKPGEYPVADPVLN
jgi:hypothetical protein